MDLDTFRFVKVDSLEDIYHDNHLDICLLKCQSHYTPLIPIQSWLSLIAYASPTLPINTLINLTNELSIGRDRINPNCGQRLLLSDMTVSRLHATLFSTTHHTFELDSNLTPYQKQDYVDNLLASHTESIGGMIDIHTHVTQSLKYYLVDHGSMHGTYLNKQRISDPKAFTNYYLSDLRSVQCQ